jgi:hypothetical protein
MSVKIGGGFSISDDILEEEEEGKKESENNNKSAPLKKNKNNNKSITPKKNKDKEKPINQSTEDPVKEDFIVEVEEEVEKKRRTIYFEMDVSNDLDDLKKKTKLSYSDIVNKALRSYMKNVKIIKKKN